MPYKNPEDRRAYLKTYNQKLKDEGYYKQYYAENKERIKKSTKVWREKNPGYHKQYYAENKTVMARQARSWAKKKRVENPDYFKNCEAKTRWARTKNGFTPEIFADRIASQQGKCALCSADFQQCKPNADHDHETGLPREILCSHCNTGLGLFKDNPDLLRKAAAYVEKWKAIAELVI